MSRSADPGHFFQTTESLAASEARAQKSKNKLGDPIDLKAKLLAVHAWKHDSVFVAGADGQARLVDLKSREVASSYAGALAPLTCLAVKGGDDPILFAGCWDKAIHSWSIASAKPRLRFVGHTDFVKSLATATIESTTVLISGSSDASIIIWDTETGAKLHQLKAHARAVLALAVSGSTLFSADSVRDIREWTLGRSSVEQTSTAPITVHDTSVNAVRARLDDEDELELWTASFDKTAKHLVARDGKWEADTTLEHPDFVKDVLVADGEARLVATACRDGDVRVWDAALGKLRCVYGGHYDEVSALVRVGASDIASVSLDGTIRTWGVDELSMEEAMKTRERPAADEMEDELGSGKKFAMTAEEEAELAELMDSD